MTSRTVLITGATGTVGSALVPELLGDPTTRLCLLLRADNPTHLLKRLGELLDYWNFPPDGPEAARIEAFKGDVHQPQLGLDDATWQWLTSQVTHIVHAAGNVRLNQSIEAARQDALGAAEQVAAFCHAARREGRLAKLQYISTVGVAGRMRGLIPERPITEPRPFHNTYEQAKAEAFILDQVAAGLPATIHRPSMVVGDSRTGRVIHFQVFYYLSEFFAGRRTCRFVPAGGESTLDIIPSDYVARAIALSLDSPHLVGSVLHLCSGPQHAPRIDHLADRLRFLLEPAPGRRVRIQRINHRLMRRSIPWLSAIAPARPRRMLRALPYLLDYLDDVQHFDNTRTRAILEPQGLCVPPVETYLDRIIAYYLARTGRIAA